MVIVKRITRCSVAVGLWLLAGLTIHQAHAEGWQDEPQARQQLHQLGLELALADVHPKITQWWQQATSPETASDQADDHLLLGLQSFWRHWAQLSFNDRQHLRTRQATLSFSEIDESALRSANALGQRTQLVQRLTPGYGDHQQLVAQLDRLLALRAQPWPALQRVTVRPHEYHPQVVNIRERLQWLGDMPQAVLHDIPELSHLEVELTEKGVPQSVELADPSFSSQAPPAEVSELDFDVAEQHSEELENNGLTENSALIEDSALMESLANSPAHSTARFNPQFYDAELEAGVKRFQARHGLTVDGVIGPQTYAWLNTPPLRRAQLLMRSMMRTLIGDELPRSYLLVNIPEYHLRLYQQDALVFESNVIVGQNQRKTPIMASKITNVVFNPPWNVPRSIINKDILPKLARDPNYLDRQGFEVLDSSGTQVIPREEWQTRFEEGAGFPYRLRQRPGRGNALGAYKFHLPNNDAIYLHDTPGRGLFARDSRAFSSGCVRVEGAEQLADWLLHDQLSSARLAALKANPETRWVKVQQALPLFMVYWPSWLGENDQLHFRNDIYGFDTAIRSPFKAG